MAKLFRSKFGAQLQMKCLKFRRIRAFMMCCVIMELGLKVLAKAEHDVAPAVCSFLQARFNIEICFCPTASDATQ